MKYYRCEELKLKLRRGPPFCFSYTRPKTYFIIGARNSGKSTFLEYIATKFFERGSPVIDLFGSSDNEGLAWGRSPYKDDVVLIHGDRVKVVAPFETVKLRDVTLDLFEEHKVFVSAMGLYESEGESHLASGRILDVLFQRQSWEKPIFVMVREAGNLFYSRLKKTKDQTIAKAEAAYLIREARHHGIALGIDTQRYTSVDIQIRDLSDYLVIKAIGRMKLPSELNFLFGLFPPRTITRMHQKYFIAMDDASIVFGSFPYVKWHKTEGEDIMEKLGIQVFRPQPTGPIVSEAEMNHRDVIDCYFENQGLLSFRQIARTLNIPKSTVAKYIKVHNEYLEELGYCPICEKAQGLNSTRPVVPKFRPRVIEDEISD